MAIKVYFAGDISHNDWRHDIAPGLRNAGDHTHDYHDANHVAVSTDEYLLETKRSGFYYVGPYFISCDHGCFHGRNGHAAGATLEEIGGCFGDMDGSGWARRKKVLAANTARIEQADLIFAHIGKRDAYGTIAEIGFAHRAGKPIILSFSPWVKGDDDMWFASAMSDIVMTAKPQDAWAVVGALFEDMAESYEPAFDELKEIIHDLRFARENVLSRMCRFGNMFWPRESVARPAIPARPVSSDAFARFADDDDLDEAA